MVVVAVVAIFLFFLFFVVAKMQHPFSSSLCGTCSALSSSWLVDCNESQARASFVTKLCTAQNKTRGGTYGSRSLMCKYADIEEGLLQNRQVLSCLFLVLNVYEDLKKKMKKREEGRKKKRKKKKRKKEKRNTDRKQRNSEACLLRGGFSEKPFFSKADSCDMF